MKLHNVLFALAALAAFLLQQAAADGATASAPVRGAVPAGAYTLDKAHASLTFRVDHLGFSNYTARFKRFDAQLQFDPADITASTVMATIDPRSLDLDNPPAGFTEALLGEQWLDAAKFSQMIFRSTKVESTGANTFRITGDFTLHGVTQPVVLDATYNGGYEGHPMDPHARIGFSAHGSLLRSAFGIAYGIPAPGTTMGVSDQVEVAIEAEFSGPPLVGATVRQGAEPAAENQP
jgi:polyisoprenoid-binding protein YceI